MLDLDRIKCNICYMLIFSLSALYTAFIGCWAITYACLPDLNVRTFGYFIILTISSLLYTTFKYTTLPSVILNIDRANNGANLDNITLLSIRTYYYDKKIGKSLVDMYQDKLIFPQSGKYIIHIDYLLGKEKSIDEMKTKSLSLELYCNNNTLEEHVILS